MKDLIDERNFKEKCARSIVKSYNVHYMTKEEVEEQKKLSPKEEISGKGLQKGQDKAFEADERYAHMPSSQYGTVSVDDPVTKEQIEKILGERDEELMESIFGTPD